MAADQNVLAALYCALSNVFRRAIIDRSGGRSPHTGVVEQSIDSKSVSTADPDEDAISFRRSRSTSSCSSRSAATTASAEAVRGSPSPKSGGAEAFRNLKKRLGLGGGPQSAWKMFSAPRPALCSVSKNPYIILGVPREADEDTIRKAYKKLAVKHHPDKGGDAEKFKEISRAYEILGDPNKKKQYDMGGSFGPGGPASDERDPFGGAGNPFSGAAGAGNPFEGFGGFQEAGFGEDPFEMFSRVFEGRAGFRGGGPDGQNPFGVRRGKPPPKILVVDVPLSELCQRQAASNLRDEKKKKTFGKNQDEDKMSGFKQVTFERSVLCQRCEGQGGRFQACGTCGGSGFETLVQQFGGNAYMQTRRQCAVCGGAGKTLLQRCGYCSGYGASTKCETASIALSPLTQDGDTFLIPDLGDQRRDGYSATLVNGDLLVMVNVVLEEQAKKKTVVDADPYVKFQHSDPEVVGDAKILERGPHGSLFAECFIPFADAVCGGKYVVLHHPNGSVVQIEVPPLTQHGCAVEVKGKGLNWRFRKLPNSNLYLKFSVGSCKKIWKSDEERAVLQAILAGDESVSGLLAELADRHEKDTGGRRGAADSPGGGSSSGPAGSGAVSGQGGKKASTTEDNAAFGAQQSSKSGFFSWFKSSSSGAGSDDGDASAAPGSFDEVDKPKTRVKCSPPMSSWEKKRLQDNLRNYRSERDLKKNEIRGQESARGDHMEPGCHVQ